MGTIRKHIIQILLLLFAIGPLQAQNVFKVPALNGQLNDQTYNARSEALGKNTITLDGIKTALENPATISSSPEVFSLAFNYDRGNSVYPKSYYLTGGASYKINDRIAIGLDTRHWIETQPFFNTIIGSETFPTDRNTFSINSIMVAGKIIEGLHLGVSAHFMVQRKIDAQKTGDQFVINTGLIYDKQVHLIKDDRLSNQKIRLAASLYNTLKNATFREVANEEVFGFRDIPIILRIGSAYYVTAPLNLGFAQNSKLLKDAPQTLDLSFHLQYTDWLKSKEYNFKTDEYHNMISIGAEGTFYNLLAVRLGYFNEKRDTEVDPDEIAVTNPRRKALTWGLGFILPTHKWSSNKIPFETRLDVLVKGMPDLVNERRTEIINPEFTDEKTQLSIGLQFNLKKFNQNEKQKL